MFTLELQDAKYSLCDRLALIKAADRTMIVEQLVHTFTPGYTNDAEYYQLPGQNLLEDQNRVKRAPRLIGCSKEQFELFPFRWS